MTRYLTASVLLLVFGAFPLLAQQLHTHPLFPLSVGDRWVYRVVDLKKVGKGDAKKSVVVEVERQEPFTQKQTDKEGKSKTETRVGFILKSTSGGKVTRDHVIVLEDGVYRIHAAGTPITPPLPFFKPVAKPWDVNSTSGNTTIKGTFTLREEQVTVPYAKLKAYKVSFDNNKKGDEERVEIDYWFADGVGMVKQRVREKDREFALELERFEKKK